MLKGSKAQLFFIIGSLFLFSEKKCEGNIVFRIINKAISNIFDVGCGVGRVLHFIWTIFTNISTVPQHLKAFSNICSGWLWRKSIWTKKSCPGDEIYLSMITDIIFNTNINFYIISIIILINIHIITTSVNFCCFRSRLSAQIEKIPPQDSFHASKQGQ